MITTPIAADRLDTHARSAAQDATLEHHSIFNCKSLKINNSVEEIDKHKDPKLESKQLTTEARTF